MNALLAARGHAAPPPELTKRRGSAAATFVPARVSAPLIFCGISGGEFGAPFLAEVERAEAVSRRALALSREVCGPRAAEAATCDLSFSALAAIREMRVKSEGRLPFPRRRRREKSVRVPP